MSRLSYGFRAFIYLLGFFVFGFMGLLMMPIALVFSFFPKSRKADTERWARALVLRGCAFFRWWCKSTGIADMRLIDHTDGRPSQILIANHLTMLDIVLLFGFIPNLQTLVNAKFAQNPFLYLTVKACGYIPLEVGDPAQGIEAFHRLDESLDQKQTIALFPEGTRSADGRLGRLKKGAFRLAEERGLVPSFIFFTSTQAFLNRQAFFPKLPGRIRLEAHIVPANSEKDWESVFKTQYDEFCRSRFVLPWNALGVDSCKI